MKATYVLWHLFAGLAALTASVAGPARLQAQEVSGGRSLSLEEARQEALAGNAGLRIAFARADMAKAAAGGASAIYWPRLDFESGFVRSNDPVFVFGTKLRQGTFGESDFDVGSLNDPAPINDWMNRISVQWKVFSPADWTGRGAASHEAEAAQWSSSRTREATLIQTEVLYRDAQRAGAQLTAARRAEEAAAGNRDVFARRVDEGVLTRADLLQAEAEYSLAVARRVDAERQEADSRRRLAVFLGGDGSGLPVLTDSLRIEAPAAGDDEAPASFDPSARADLLALASARDAAEAGSRRAGRQFLPEIGVFGDYSIHAADAFRNDGDNWTVGVGLRWNLFSGFSRSNDRQQADAARAIAEARYEEALRQASSELAEARDGFRAARQAVAATIAADAAAQAGAELMTRRFEEGLATAADLLQAESRRAQSESQAIDAQANLLMAEARLRFVTTMHQNGNDR
ncbi:MAG: TolC family protein [Candidatus Palauibacterales bacterium]|nr:TolC family protein [Candidatus Palauibacterales bacterium]